MIAFTREDAEAFVSVFKGMAGRAVVPSSSDVYRVMGILNRTESGPPVPVPIDEDGPLRRKPSIHGDRAEKQWVERVVLAEPALPACVLRFPAVYGPGSFRHWDWVKRMIDQRPAIIVGKGEATFRFSHSYAQDIGWATALAATNQRSAGASTTSAKERYRPNAGDSRTSHRLWDGKATSLRFPTNKCLAVTGCRSPSKTGCWIRLRIRRELGFSEVSDYVSGIRDTIEWQRTTPASRRSNRSITPRKTAYSRKSDLAVDRQRHNPPMQWTEPKDKFLVVREPAPRRSGTDRHYVRQRVHTTIISRIIRRQPKYIRQMPNESKIKVGKRFSARQPVC